MKPAGAGGKGGVVIIPAFNEQKDIADVVREVRQASGFPVIVVDDASSDDTIARARGAGARIVPLSQQLGAWGATQTGLRLAYMFPRLQRRRQLYVSVEAVLSLLVMRKTLRV